jgi:hypothetical protein
MYKAVFNSPPPHTHRKRKRKKKEKRKKVRCSGSHLLIPATWKVEIRRTEV